MGRVTRTSADPGPSTELAGNAAGSTGPAGRAGLVASTGTPRGGGPAPTRSGGAPPTGPDATGPRGTRRTVFRSVRLIALAVIVYYLVLPQLGNQRDTARSLRTVNVWLLLLGLALQLSAMFSYSMLTAAALPKRAVRLGTLIRIQLSTKALGNVMPGGSAASSALSFRLLTRAGVAGPDVGFALAASGLGSAVILNLLFLTALLVSIPLSGVNPLYVSVALVGLFVLLLFGLLVFALLRGQRGAENIARRLAARITFLDEDRSALLVARLAIRLRDLLEARELLRALIMWSLTNWLLDAASLWVFLRAFGGSVRLDSLIVAFCVANVLAVIPITPGGLGIVDGAYVPMLLFFGLPRRVISLGVPSYRFSQYWLPIPMGALVYLTLRVGPWRIDRDGPPLGGLRQEAAEAAGSTSTVFDWQERAQDPAVTRSRRTPPDTSDPDAAANGQ